MIHPPLLESPPRPRGALLIAPWIATVLLGYALLFEYSVASGAGAQAPASWPPGGTVARDPSRPTLLLIAHPYCACTRASLAELSRLRTRLGDRVATKVLFALPPGLPRGWNASDLLAHARALEGVEVVLDPGGVEAARFGALTSGQVLLYSAGGELLFAGGITPTRGHQGPSVGRDRILALVEGLPVPRETSAVYGCALGGAPDPRREVSQLEHLEFSAGAWCHAGGPR